MITQWFKASEVQPDTDLPVLIGSSNGPDYDSRMQFAEGKWYEWERHQWVETTDIPELWAYWPDPRTPVLDFDLQSLLEHYQDEVKKMDQTLKDKPWLTKMYYHADFVGEQADMNRAAQHVADYLIEKLGTQ